MGLHVWLSRRRYKATGTVKGKLRLATTVGSHHALTFSRTKGIDYDLEVSLSRITRVEAVDPWPSLRIHWNLKGPRSETFHPLRLHKLLSFDPDDEERRAFAGVVEELIAAFEGIDATKVGRGWLDAPVVPWEKVDRWPEASGAGTDDGAYRSAQVPIVARREKPSVLEALLTWLTSSPEKRWRDSARDMVLTSRQLYVRHWNRSIYTLPLATLRTRLDASWEGTRDAVYVFGRNTVVVVPHRQGCEVTAALDAHLQRPGSAG